MEQTRKHIVLYGWVQGVGLRYRAVQAASLYGVTGWVRNEYDGSVSMELQGTEAQIEQVLLAVERGSWVRIENIDSHTIPLAENERDFHAR